MNSDAEMKAILEEARTIASVGLSSNPQKESYEVGEYLLEQGYRVIPVNPAAGEILGQKSYASLEEVPEQIDVVQVFRRPEDVPPVMEAAIRAGAKAVWMQEDIVNEEAAARARDAGLKVVMDACMMKSHKRLIKGQ